ncbi:lysophospholipid acyltransferase family protein [Nakamurella leprariae]|uniref:1-acyl-sn-glycerol-3-phosphate acyltransferase n=1 Tax=Nakamurella leprariae TaxID=2803911 RepID=A0A938YDE8_9ACTN|nr:lysophospholipid acyltransferase family protein [Nakamurella leprariae]MBM9466139.1 1-acyl-sn-glycerol-3-phosphate acyltransferase [Nakamurella leprariae]
MERPVRTVVGAAVVVVAGTVVHRLRYARSPVVPRRGPAVLVVNHLATTETLAVARMVVTHRRFPHFLIMDRAFAWPVVGRLLRIARQIPVQRGSAAAAAAVEAAAAELGRGHLVVLYPEGRITRDPDLWPGPGRSGAARLALRFPAAPLIPVGQWGARPGARHLWHRHTVKLVVGAPIDRTRWAGRTDTAAARELTDVIMDEIRALVGRLRGVTPPDPGTTVDREG